MKHCKIVIGSGYGDEGKGISTDYLAKDWADMIVRFNGGSQAAHTVHNEYGSHVFGHFGSGTLRGIPTYLAQKFIVNPTTFRKEHKELLEKNVHPVVYVHPECYVTTLFDMLINRELETIRCNDRHGSVGVGINETVTREYDKKVRLRVSDLTKDTMPSILQMLADHYLPMRMEEVGLPKGVLKKYDIQTMVKAMLFDINYFLRHTIIHDDFIFGEVNNVVFEGAQGLLLDEFYGIFPHVTRSRTGLNNVVPMLRMVDTVDVYYVTRAYTTRHGAGPLQEEEKMPEWVVDNTNKPHQFQGTLRYSPLDISFLGERMYEDFKPLAGVANKHLIVTCMDQVPENISFIEKGKRVIQPAKGFVQALSACTNCSEMLLNYSKVTPNTMKKEI